MWKLGSVLITFFSIIVLVQDEHNNILLIQVPITNYVQVLSDMFLLVVLCILQEFSSV